MKAIYYNENLDPKEFEVIKDNGNGTVTIGTGTTVAVANAPVTKEPKAGCVTLGAPAEPTKKTK